MGSEQLVLLGSTGSIGCSTLDIVRLHRDKYSVFALIAGKNESKLMNQIEEFSPRYAALTQRVWSGPRKIGSTTILDRSEAYNVVDASEVTGVLVAIVGMDGLLPVYRSLAAKKDVLLANKESLVCAGRLLCGLVEQGKGRLFPVDSEHSAIYQLLQGRDHPSVKKITLTASGGPFLDIPLEKLASVTPDEAVRHPRWLMGKKISIDCATMVNKALEVIEASWLFDLADANIDVVIHPESIVHGLVEFSDGAQFAHLSQPDMRGAISFALTRGTDRLNGVMETLNLARVGALTFREVDPHRFGAIELGRDALRTGRALPAVFNCANELAVEAFLWGKCSFVQIISTIEDALDAFSDVDYHSVEDLFMLRSELTEWFRRRIGA